MKTLKKTLALLLMLCMVLNVLSMTAMAVVEENGGTTEPTEEVVAPTGESTPTETTASEPTPTDTTPTGDTVDDTVDDTTDDTTDDPEQNIALLSDDGTSSLTITKKPANGMSFLSKIEPTERLRRRFTVLCLADKQYAKCISAAVRGNGTAGTGHVNLLKGSQCFDLRHTSLVNFLIATGMGYKNVVKLHVGAVTDAIDNVFFQHGFEFATIFFTNTHFAAVHGNTRLKL